MSVDMSPASRVGTQLTRYLPVNCLQDSVLTVSHGDVLRERPFEIQSPDAEMLHSRLQQKRSCFTGKEVWKLLNAGYREICSCSSEQIVLLFVLGSRVLKRDAGRSGDRRRLG